VAVVGANPAARMSARMERARERWEWATRAARMAVYERVEWGSARSVRAERKRWSAASGRCAREKAQRRVRKGGSSSAAEWKGVRERERREEASGRSPAEARREVRCATVPGDGVMGLVADAAAAVG
jgi:hypothetical protein